MNLLISIHIVDENDLFTCAINSVKLKKFIETLSNEIENEILIDNIDNIKRLLKAIDIEIKINSGELNRDQINRESFRNPDSTYYRYRNIDYHIFHECLEECLVELPEQIDMLCEFYYD